MGILKAKNSAADKGSAAVASLSIHNHRVEVVVCTSVRRGRRQRSPGRNRINKKKRARDISHGCSRLRAEDKSPLGPT